MNQAIQPSLPTAICQIVDTTPDYEKMYLAELEKAKPMHNVVIGLHELILENNDHVVTPMMLTIIKLLNDNHLLP